MFGLYHHIDIALCARRIYRRGDPELHHLPRLVGQGRRALDIGANRGVYSYWLSKVARSVDAFEPNPQLAQALASARFKGVTVHALALSDHEGTSRLVVPGHRKGGLDTPSAHLANSADDAGAAAYEVKLAPLDQFNFTDVDFIKIDVEGFEESVLDGGWRTITACRPTMLIELVDRLRPGCLARVTERLRGAGYGARFLDGGAWHALADLGPGDQGPSGRFVPNFLFTPEEKSGQLLAAAGA